MDQPRRADGEAGAVAGRPAIGVDEDEAILEVLLEQYDSEPRLRTAIAAEIDARFRRRMAVLVLDSSGFTRTVRAMGIVHFLALLQRLDSVVQPIIEVHRGQTVAREGDTIFVVFPDAQTAVTAAVTIQAQVHEDNGPRPQSDEINCSIGIGFGDILSVGTHHIAGDEVNTAFKLGEDLAESGEILVTPAVAAALGATAPAMEPAEFHLSGVTLRAYRVR